MNKRQFCLFLVEGLSFVELTGSGDKISARLGGDIMYNDDSEKPVGLFIHDKNGTNRMSLYITESGEPSLILRDSNKNPRTLLGRTELINKTTGSTEIRRESSLVLFNEKSNVLWSAP